MIIDESYQKENEEHKKSQDYYMYDKPLPIMDVNIASIEDNPAI